jgi:site-specific DNA-methyltransferase (adenine-specific)
MAFQTLLGPSTMLAYLAMMAPRLIELRRVLKPTGSLYLHCDPTASHYLKLLLNAVFGPEFFQNEIIWCYEIGGRTKKRWARKHDTILFYSKTNEFQFDWSAVAEPRKPGTHMKVKIDEDGREYQEKRDAKSAKVYRYYVDEGTIPPDWWIGPQQINREAAERLGYPTQKPLPLLERIIKASSEPGDLVLDPFCGCGTTIAAAEKLKRRWVGIDITYLAVSLIKSRLTAMGASDYKVLGEPTTADDAAELAASDPYQFQLWALSLIGARPRELKKGADQGVDGRLPFFDEAGGMPKQVIASVKAGKLHAHYLRDLVGVVQREQAEIGVLISFHEPTQPMRKEAASGGFYKSPWGQHPKIQLITVAELLEGKQIDMPAGGAHMTQVALPPTPEETVHPDQLGLGE